MPLRRLTDMLATSRSRHRHTDTFVTIMLQRESLPWLAAREPHRVDLIYDAAPSTRDVSVNSATANNDASSGPS